MKKRITSAALALCLILSLLPVTALAEEPSSGSWGSTMTWTYDPGTDTLTISGQGAMSNLESDRPAEADQWKGTAARVVIEPGVTTVGKAAFQGWTALDSVSLPAGVTAIGDSAFRDCTSLTQVNLPDTVTYIGEYAFSKTDIAGITIPDGVLYIGGYSFSGCASLQAIATPPSVILIDRYAFDGCRGLTSVQLSEGTRLDQGVFQDCSGLTSIRIPKNCLGNTHNLFWGCTSLREVTIEDSIYTANLGNVSTYMDCNNLEILNIPASTRPEKSEFLLGFTTPKSLTVNYGGSQYRWDSISLTENSNVSLTVNCAVNHPGGFLSDSNGTCGWEYNRDTNVLKLELRCNSQTAAYVIKPPSSGSPMPWTQYLEADTLIMVTVKEGSPSRKFEIKSGVFPAHAVLHFDTYASSGVFPTDVTAHRLKNEPATVSCWADDGYSLGYSCSTCNNVPQLAPQPAARRPHTLVSTPAVDSTCQSTGSAFGMHCYYKCAPVVIPPVETPASNHFYGVDPVWHISKNPTDTTEGLRYRVCEICSEKDYETIPARGHKWGEEKSSITTAPTCTDDGVRTYTKQCLNPDCSKEITRTEPIPKKGHTKHWEFAVLPTCVTPGHSEYFTCFTCGIHLTEPTELPPTGIHTPGTVIKEEITSDRTCTQAGSKDVTYACTVCQQEFIQTESISPIGHVWGREDLGVVTTPPTCTAEGVKTYTTSCTAAGCDGTQTRTEPVRPNGHTQDIIPPVQATCEHGGKTEGIRCSVCQTIIKAPTDTPMKDHTRTTIAAVPATCVSGGKTEGIQCSVCKKILTAPQDVPPTGVHTPGAVVSEVVTQEASCTKAGSKEVTFQCSVCQQELKRTETISPTEHQEVEILAVDPTCTTPGSTAGKECSLCHFVFVAPQPIPAAHTDIVTIIGKPATCTDKGLTNGRRCDACGDTIKAQEEISPLEHSWITDGTGTETISKEPSCTQEGEKTISGGSKCVRCGEKRTDLVTIPIPPNGHSWGEESSTVTKPVTCTQDGVTTFTQACTAAGCGTTRTRTEPILSAGHTWGNWTTTTQPTAAQPGSEKRVCSSCQAEQTREIPATGSGGEENPGQDPKPPAAVQVTFSLNYPGASAPTTLTAGADGRLAALPANPSRSGFDFSGWYTSISGGSLVSTTTVFQANTTVYARWSETSATPDIPSSPYYRIYTPSRTPGGSYSVSHSYAVEGTRVTVELNPKRDYELDWLSAVNLDTGRELRLNARYSDEYTFIMPASDVELEITYTDTYIGGPYYVSTETESAPSAKPLKWYFSNGSIYHVTDGLVPINSPLTRDMLISVLYNMDDSSSGDPTFWATNNAIVPDIYMSWLWGVDKAISREQTAMILYCYARHMGYSTAQSTNITGYSDYSQIRAIARPAMAWVQAAGLITNTSDSTLSPRATLTCGQANSILSRFVSTVAWRR